MRCELPPVGPSSFIVVDDIILYAYVVQCLEVITVPLSLNQLLLLHVMSATICCPESRLQPVDLAYFGL